MEYKGEHVAEHNSGNIGIAFLGDYSKRPLTKDQLTSFHTLMGILEGEYNIKSVKTHGDFNPTKEKELAGARKQLKGVLKN